MSVTMRAVVVVTLSIILSCALYTWAFEMPPISEAGDELIDIVLSDAFDDLFDGGTTKINGQVLLEHVKANTKLRSADFDKIFSAMLGAQSPEELNNKNFSWDEATNVINALIKLADNISVNNSRRKGSKYVYEDERITEAKKIRKEKRQKKKTHDKKEEL